MTAMKLMPDSADPIVKRHRLSTRLWHWLNALLLYILFTSGLGIFNAHPRLYWGAYGANFDPAWLSPASFMDLKFRPLTTRPFFTSKHGIILLVKVMIIFLSPQY